MRSTGAGLLRGGICRRRDVPAELQGRWRGREDVPGAMRRGDRRRSVDLSGFVPRLRGRLSGTGHGRLLQHVGNRVHRRAVRTRPSLRAVERVLLGAVHSAAGDRHLSRPRNLAVHRSDLLRDTAVRDIRPAVRSGLSAAYSTRQVFRSGDEGVHRPGLRSEPRMCGRESDLHAAVPAAHPNRGMRQRVVWRAMRNLSSVPARCRVSSDGVCRAPG